MSEVREEGVSEEGADERACGVISGALFFMDNIQSYVRWPHFSCIIFNTKPYVVNSSISLMNSSR